MLTMKVKAFDKEGNEFDKDVTLIEQNGKKVLDFGWPVQYYVEDLVVHYPYTKDLCIDMMGQNHKGVPQVCIPKETMNVIIEKLVPSFLKQRELQ